MICKNFAKTAREEGFDDIAKHFELTASIEKAHEERYKILEKNIQNGSVFNKSGEIMWKCNNCGYLHKSKSAPDVCPMRKFRIFPMKTFIQTKRNEINELKEILYSYDESDSVCEDLQ